MQMVCLYMYMSIVLSYISVTRFSLYFHGWQASCVGHVCDTLCYHLDVASFVACNNSGQSWSLKSSILLSGKDLTDQGDEDVQFDPFVENFVLERLSVQSPLWVRLETVYCGMSAQSSRFSCLMPSWCY